MLMTNVEIAEGDNSKLLDMYIYWDNWVECHERPPQHPTGLQAAVMDVSKRYAEVTMGMAVSQRDRIRAEIIGRMRGKRKTK